ncbi:asparagine synthase-related protein [Streptomyces sp. NPDC017988]|uniref:asparagine synthase-related protein n=1 Tax=Streptomyces sp. NPDC017988 TaxID=3365025 RepID=UPI0037BCECE1
MSEEWFAVLPDSDAALAAERMLRPLTSSVVDHASGRPWLMGHWRTGTVLVAEAGASKVAVVGQCPTTATTLRTALGKIRSVDEAETVTDKVPGCFTLVASVDGRVRVQGTLAAVRRVFRARIGDAVVAADRAEVLAHLVSDGWDEAWVALRLTLLAQPYPFQETTPWRAVRAVPADHWLRLDPDGTAVERRRWTPPEAVLPLREGAVVLREALLSAVEARTSTHRTVSTDLSGGMDSTSVAFLATRSPVELVTYRWAEHDSGNDDAEYAQRAATALPHARHQVDSLQDVAPMFGGLAPGGTADREEPFAWVRSRARIEHVARSMARAGSLMHLTGHGGDELFRPGYRRLHDLVRHSCTEGVRQTRAYRAMAHWPLPALFRELTDSSGPARELARAARSLEKQPPAPHEPYLGWGVAPLRMPPWATRHALAATRDLLRRTATGPVTPLAPTRGQHEALLLARIAGVNVAQADRISTAHGVHLAAPYLDDAVLHAALAVRLQERDTPWHFKPLLATAMRGLVPGPLLDRTTKGNFNADFYVGLRRHRADMVALFDDSELARHELIDPAVVRRVLLQPHPTTTLLARMDGTFATEMWLRAIRAPRAGPMAPPATT